MHNKCIQSALVSGLFLLSITVTSVVLAAPPSKETSSGTHTQNWDRSIPSSTRFTVLAEFNNQAVRDNNTGLVWEQAPDAAFRTWTASTTHCLQRNVGNTRGWRLPSVVELISLTDPTLPSPFIPSAVFSGIQISGYWSATTFADSSTNAYSFDTFSGGVGGGLKSIPAPAWCVRGGMNAAQY